MGYCGRADLVRMFHLAGDGRDDLLAEFTGYTFTPDRRNNLQPVQKKFVDEIVNGETTVESIPPPLDPNENLAPVPFVRPERFEAYDEEDPDSHDSDGKKHYTVQDLTGRTPAAVSQSEPPPLAPWPRLQHRLTRLLQEETSGHEIDMRALVRDICHGRLPHTLPYRRRRRWPRRLNLIIDRSRRLTPFWHDQNLVTQRLRRLIGWNNLYEFRITDGFDEPLAMGQARRVNKKVMDGDAILVLGDCGSLTDYPPLHHSWLHAGKRFCITGVAPKILLPAPVWRWPVALNKYWQMQPWEQTRSLPGNKNIAERALELLTLVSPAIRIEPGLLRTVRRLLPPSQADAGTEADVWSHPAVASSSSVALTIANEKQPDLQQGFAAKNEALRSRVLEAIEKWHKALPGEIWHEELANLGHALPGSYKEALHLAQQDLAMIAEALAEQGSSHHMPEWEKIRDWLARLNVRTSHNKTMWDPGSRLGRALQQARATLRPAINSLQVSEVEDPRLWGPEGEERLWQVRQVGCKIYVEQTEILSSRQPRTPGSFMAFLRATRPVIHQVAPDRVSTYHTIDSGAAVEFSLPSDSWRLRWDCGSLTLGTLTKPDWAEAMGRDQYGLWLRFRVGEVTQKLRWIPPGRFLMGSPKDEAGRFDREAQHEVVITKGYWFFDTPVTQALWTAVMSDNPSRFKSQIRPVENISWEDSQKFIETINTSYPGLALRLPTEAEWEYACRAGTTTATYAGDLDIKGENNAPVLDYIAWYGGNSGVDFELENGYDSSNWTDKQYKHTKAGSHPVAGKISNAWGLYDMLGNVYEWCEDWYAVYDLEQQENPVGPALGTLRVSRGGGWSRDARDVRAAYRDYRTPDGRFDNLGFRCARGQEPVG